MKNKGMKIRRTHVFILILLFLVLCTFVAKGIILLDPDFGWRIRTGALIREEGIPLSDPYSYTMPEFRFVDHAWTVDVAISFLYGKGGMFLLSLVSSFLALAAVFLSFKLTHWMLQGYGVSSRKALLISASIPILLGIGVFLPFFGVRAQVVSWVLMSFFLLLLFQESRETKLSLFFPILFFVWANLHGGFLIGLVAFFLVLLIRAFEKKLTILEAFSFVCSVGVTFLTPYKVDLWREVLSSVADVKLAWSIEEWQPGLFMFDLLLLGFTTLAVTGILRYRHRFQTESLLLVLAFFLAGMWSRRHLPFFILASLPYVSSAIWFFYQDIFSLKGAKERFQKAHTFGLGFAFILLVLQSFFVLWNSRLATEKQFYPMNAVLFLQSNPPKGEIFSDYGWGGYLIWKYPEKKVFIDGRMPSWVLTSDGHKKFSSFELYRDILRGSTSYKPVFDAYGVTTVLWPNEKKEEQGILHSVSRILSGQKKDTSVIEAIEKDGWQKVYEDNVSVIYQDPLETTPR